MPDLDKIREMFQTQQASLHSCAKEGDLAHLRANEERILDSLNRMEKGQEKVAEALQMLASQGEQLIFLHQDFNREREENAKRFENLFKRVHSLETSPGEDGKGFKRDVFLVSVPAGFTLVLWIIGRLVH